MDNAAELYQFDLSKGEWDQCEILLKVLHPFKVASVKLQSTSRPRIDQVFWTYENLFNSIDKLETFLNRQRRHPWARNLVPAVEAMRMRLSTYYAKTDKPFVYPDAVILEPNAKLLLFKGPSFEAHFHDQYNQACRQRFEEFYNSQPDIIEPVSCTINSRKRKRHDDVPGLEFEDEYWKAIAQAQQQRRAQNEYDLYIAAGPLAN